MVQWPEDKAIGIRLKPDEWDLIAQCKSKTGLTLYQLFLRSVEKWLEVVTPIVSKKREKGRRDTVVWVKKEDYKKIEEKAKQLNISMGVLTREIMLREAREILQEGGGFHEKQRKESKDEGIS